MSDKINKFQNKYNFDINTTEDTESVNPKNSIVKVLEDNSTPNNFKIENIKDNSPKLKIEIEKTDDEKKKIKADSKTYFQNLKRKVILNHKLCQLFIHNFYREEFDSTRKSTYFLFGFPTIVTGLFIKISPYHPLLGVTFNIAFLSSLFVFIYFFNSEMKKLSQMKYNDLGQQIRMIKNEMVLYNPLAKPILDNDLIVDEDEKLNKKL